MFVQRHCRAINQSPMMSSTYFLVHVFYGKGKLPHPQNVPKVAEKCCCKESETFSLVGFSLD